MSSSSPLSLAALDAAAAATLGAELVDRDRLDVAGRRQRDDEGLVVDQVFDVELTRIGDQDGASGTPEGRPDLGQLVLDDLVELVLVGEDRFEFGDGLAELGHLVVDLDTGEPGQSAEVHVEDVVGLHLGELERFGHQPAAGIGAVFGGPDGGDDLVDDVEGLDETLEDVFPGLGLVEAVLAAPGHDLALVTHVADQRVTQVERARDVRRRAPPCSR